MTSLRLLPPPPGHHEHDLPVQWDGTLVVWGEWEHRATSWEYHAPQGDRLCIACGELRGYESVDGKPAPRRTRAEIAAGAVWTRLYLHRCQHCYLDTVTELPSMKVWELDDSDYGPDGSTDPEETP